jgi:hypothetical protein
MPAYELYSKRQKAKEKAGQEDVYQYDDLPNPFRVQVIHLWAQAIGEWYGSRAYGMTDTLANTMWKQIYGYMIDEKGVFALVKGADNPHEQCCNYLLNAPTLDALDLIEVTFTVVDSSMRELDEYERKRERVMDADLAIGKLNKRFREHGIGYEFAGGELIRVDSKYIHANPCVRPLACFTTREMGFRGLAKSSWKRTSTTGKRITKRPAVCTAKGWAFDPHKDTAKALLEIVFANGLVPPYIQQQLKHLQLLLETSAPVMRNKAAAHGQGPAPVSVPQHYVAYTLHMTASNIVFLVESFKLAK